MVWATSKASDQPARMRSLIRAFASEATDQTSLEFLSLKGGCIGLYESTLVKMPHCLESHVAAQICFLYVLRQHHLVLLQLKLQQKGKGKYFCQFSEGNKELKHLLL